MGTTKVSGCKWGTPRAKVLRARLHNCSMDLLAGNARLALHATSAAPSSLSGSRARTSAYVRQGIQHAPPHRRSTRTSAHGQTMARVRVGMTMTQGLCHVRAAKQTMARHPFCCTPSKVGLACIVAMMVCSTLDPGRTSVGVVSAARSVHAMKNLDTTRKPGRCKLQLSLLGPASMAKAPNASPATSGSDGYAAIALTIASCACRFSTSSCFKTLAGKRRRLHRQTKISVLDRAHPTARVTAEVAHRTGSRVAACYKLIKHCARGALNLRTARMTRHARQHLDVRALVHQRVANKRCKI